MANLQNISAVKPGHSKKIGHNTTMQRHNSGMHHFSLRYHSTTVVEYLGNTLIVNTGGWFSKTTAERMRHGLYCSGTGLRLTTDGLAGQRGVWRVYSPQGDAWTVRGSKLILVRTDTGWRRA